jgi:nucleoside-diphosphate-sugar epimerase
MNLFVTGGTGFIGSHFINLAITAGHKIWAIRRPGSKPKIELLAEPIWIYGDLQQDYKKYLKKVEVLVHFAAHSANLPYDSLENCLHWNLMIPLKLFNDAYSAGIKNYLVAGSCFEYGESGEKFEFIPPDAPLTPTASYPASKGAFSIIINAWAIMNKAKLKYLRIFQVYGEGESESRFWPSLKRAAQKGENFSMTNGKQVRDFINVKDVAKRFIDELYFEAIKFGKPFIDNVGTGRPQTVHEFAEYWWKRWNASGRLEIGALPYRKNDIMRYVPKIIKK